MRKFLLVTMALPFFFAANMGAQTAKKRPTFKSKVPVAKETLLPAPYEIHVWVNSLGIISAAIIATPTYPATNESSFSAFLKDHFAVKQSAPLSVKREYPKIIIKFLSEDDISTLINAINLVRVSDKAVVELDGITDDVRLIVSQKLTKDEMVSVRPNPLTLIVEMNEQQGLTLNNDEMGRVSDMSTLIKFLRNVFRERENNGVFRENTNEVEKTVFIKVPLTGKTADMVKIAKALKESGADPIGFQVDEMVNERLDLEPFLPTLPPPKKKPHR